MARPMPEPPSWLYRVTFALFGVEVGAFIVAVFNGREEIALLDQLSTPIGVVTGAVAIYLVLYDFAGRPSHGAPPHRPGWAGTVVIMVLFAVGGAFAFSEVAAAYEEKRDVFALHYGVWEKPCERTEGPRLLDDRGADRQRFLCRFKVDKQFAAEIFVTDYFSSDALEESSPKNTDPQVKIVERGTWTGPGPSSGTYIKFTLKANKNYARYWLRDGDGPVVVMSSMDTTNEPDASEFKIAREALLAKRYQLHKVSS